MMVVDTALLTLPLLVVDDGDDDGGGHCSADTASQRSASSSPALLVQLSLISISLYSGLFNFNHCSAASTLAGRTY